ncbi:MAG: hypothetical protein ACRC9R_03920, partial [Enterovibrio sp.]
MFFYDRIEDKWKNATRSINVSGRSSTPKSRGKPNDEEKWDTVVKGILPRYYGPAFTEDTM